MNIEANIALIIGIPLTLAYIFLLLKHLAPYIKQAHRSSSLKERGGLSMTEAEIVNIEPREFGGLKRSLCTIYIVRIRYNAENAAYVSEQSELIFAKKPAESAGQKITVLYSIEMPGAVITPDDRESAGAAAMLIKIIISIMTAFGLIFAVMYCMGKYGLDD